MGGKDKLLGFRYGGKKRITWKNIQYICNIYIFHNITALFSGSRREPVIRLGQKTQLQYRPMAVPRCLAWWNKKKVEKLDQFVCDE